MFILGEIGMRKTPKGLKTFLVEKKLYYNII